MKQFDIACIIDDDPIYVFGTKKMMHLTNFCKNFLVFGNGKAALDFLGPVLRSGDLDAIPEVILLDINMPIMDGWQFLDVFVQIPTLKHITIYIVSSSDNPKDKLKAAEYSEVGNFIVKPMSQNDLLEMMQADE